MEIWNFMWFKENRLTSLKQRKTKELCVFLKFEVIRKTKKIWLENSENLKCEILWFPSPMTFSCPGHSYLDHSVTCNDNFQIKYNNMQLFTPFSNTMYCYDKNYTFANGNKKDCGRFPFQNVKRLKPQFFLYSVLMWKTVIRMHI